MVKILSQDEIDALFRAAQGHGRKAKNRSHAPDLHRPQFSAVGQISKEQLRSVSLLHETFARTLTHSLRAYLRVGSPDSTWTADAFSRQ